MIPTILAAPPMVGAPDAVEQTAAALPSQQQYLDNLLAMNPLTAVVLAVLGLACLFWGFKFFKFIVIGNAAIIGGTAGYFLGQLLEGSNPMMPVFATIAGAALLGFAAWPLMKAAVGIMGAIAGFVIGYGGWHYAAQAMGHPALSQYAWAGAALGAVALGLLSFPAFRWTIIIFTSFEGSSAAVSGIVALLMRHEEWRPSIVNHLQGSLYLLPMVIFLPTLMGVVVQASSGKKKKPSS